MHIHQTLIHSTLKHTFPKTTRPINTLAHVKKKKKKTIAPFKTEQEAFASAPLPNPPVLCDREGIRRLRGRDDASWLRLVTADPRASRDARVRWYDIALFTVAMFGVVVMVLELELAFDMPSHSRVTGATTEVLRLVIFADTVVLLALLVMYYGHLQRSEDRAVPADEADGSVRHMRTLRFIIFRGNLAWRFALEFAVCAVHAVPFVDLLLPDYALDKVGLLMFARLYLGARLVRDFSRVYVHRDAIGRTPLYRAAGAPDIDARMTLRMLFANHPVWFTFVVSTSAFLLTTYVVHVLERDDPQQDWSFMDALWFVVASMTTTGYGDLTPTSWPGRFVASIGMLVGVMLSALFVAVVNRHLDLGAAEVVARRWVYENRHVSEERDLAARVIQLHWRFRSWRKSLPDAQLDAARMRSARRQLAAELAPISSAIEPLRRRRKLAAEALHADPVALRVAAMQRSIEKMTRFQQAQHLELLATLQNITST